MRGRDHVTRLKPEQGDHPLKFAGSHNQSPLVTMLISIHIHDRNIHSTFSAHHLCASVSIKHGLRSTDYGLGIKQGLGIKHGLRYKWRTKHYGLGIKYGLRYKTRTVRYGLGIKHEERFYKVNKFSH